MYNEKIIFDNNIKNSKIIFDDIEYNFAKPKGDNVVEKSIIICDENLDDDNILKMSIMEVKIKNLHYTELVIMHNNKINNLKLINKEISGMNVNLTFENNTFLNFTRYSTLDDKRRDMPKIGYNIYLNCLEGNIEKHSLKKNGFIKQNILDTYLIKNYQDCGLIYEMIVLFLMNMNYTYKSEFRPIKKDRVINVSNKEYQEFKHDNFNNTYINKNYIKNNSPDLGSSCTERRIIPGCYSKRKLNMIETNTLKNTTYLEFKDNVFNVKKLCF